MGRHRTRKLASVKSIARFSIALGTFVCLNDLATAEMKLVLSGHEASPIVRFELSGTSVTEPSHSGTYLGHVFHFDDGSHAFPSEITNSKVILGGYPLADGGGTISNLTRNVTSPITAIALQGSRLFPRDGFGVGFNPSLPFNTDDVFGWSGSGHIDLSISNLTFSDLTAGTYSGTTIVGGFMGTLTIVPEPSLTSLLVVGFCCVIHRLR